MLAFCVKFGKFDCISPFVNPALPSRRIKSRADQGAKAKCHAILVSQIYSVLSYFLYNRVKFI